ncbi:arylsulfatase [Anopheles sinensis]|uniref:Arylsulfatase n=1 Tax=Anopheles sinensis TaxID=74873 RepID=A0A084VSU7_ANOSI|nr:arylsulfatase [Anopheles sinensis]
MEAEEAKTAGQTQHGEGGSHKNGPPGWDGLAAFVNYCTYTYTALSFISGRLPLCNAAGLFPFSTADRRKISPRGREGNSSTATKRTVSHSNPPDGRPESPQCRCEVMSFD